MTQVHDGVFTVLGDCIFQLYKPCESMNKFRCQVYARESFKLWICISNFALATFVFSLFFKYHNNSTYNIFNIYIPRFKQKSWRLLSYTSTRENCFRYQSKIKKYWRNIPWRLKKKKKKIEPSFSQSHIYTPRAELSSTRKLLKETYTAREEVAGAGKTRREEDEEGASNGIAERLIVAVVKPAGDLAPIEINSRRERARLADALPHLLFFPRCVALSLYRWVRVVQWDEEIIRRDEVENFVQIFFWRWNFYATGVSVNYSMFDACGFRIL